MEQRSGVVFQQATNDYLRLLTQQKITIRKQSDNTLASIFSDDGVTPKANPFTSGSDGEYSYFAANGLYKEEIGDPPFETRENILLHDPGETRLPTTSTNEAAARFDGTEGNVQDSPNGPYFSDGGSVTGPGGVVLGGESTLNLPPDNDLDEVTGIGWHTTDGSTLNAPSSDTYRVVTAGFGSKIQFAIHLGVSNDGQIYARNFQSGGSAGDWRKIITELGGQLSGALDFRAEQTLASGSTTDLGSVAANFVRITGTTPITSFGTAAAGVWRIVRFVDALTLTHSASSLILPGSADITTAANDVLLARSLGSGDWQVMIYQRA
ncbi:MAG: hypothetical protein ACOC91_03635, partial [bacterium]